MHLEDPEGSRRRPQPERARPLEASHTVVDSRCLGHVATPAADQHACRRATETRRRRVTVPASRSPLSPIASSTRRLRRKRRRHTGTLQLQTGHDRSATWYRTRRCCHHRPGGNYTKDIGNALSSSTRLTRGFRVAPEPLRRGSRRLPTPASWGQRPPIAALGIDLPMLLDLLTAGQALPRGTLVLPPLRDSRWDRASATKKVAAARCLGWGGSPSPRRSGPFPPQRRCRRRNRLDGPCPWRRCEPETSSRSRVLVTPSAHRWRRLAAVELAPHVGSTLPADSVRVASDPHRALEATASRTASALGSRLRESRRVDTSADLDGWRASVRAPKSPDRNATLADTRRDSRRTCADPTVRGVDVATDNDPTSPLDGDHVRRSMQSRNPARRHEACCGDARPVAARCSEPIRPAPPEGGSRSDKPVPTTIARSSLRNPLAAHPAEVLEDVATSGLLTPLDRLLAPPAPGTAAGAGDR
jgi:hypothetical protein